MSSKSINAKGEIKVTPTPTDGIEDNQLTELELLKRILLELKKTTLHLSLLTREEIGDKDVLL